MVVWRAPLRDDARAVSFSRRRRGRFVQRDCPQRANLPQMDAERLHQLHQRGDKTRLNMPARVYFWQRESNLLSLVL